MNRIRISILLSVVALSSMVGQSSKVEGGADQHHDERGTICVLPNSPDPPTRISPGGDYNPATLTIGVDHQQPIPWPHKRRTLIENLDLKGRHLIVLRSDRKRIQSFYFRFSDYRDTKLCVAYDGYQGVQFGDKYTTYWCRCN